MANQRKAVQPERLLYPIYSVKMAGYADTPEGAFELQETLMTDDESGTFVIGRAIDASEIELPDDDDVQVHDIVVMELPGDDADDDDDDDDAGRGVSSLGISTPDGIQSDTYIVP